MPTTHHVIEVTRRGNDVVPASIPQLVVGDTVRYSFKGAGDLFITFPGTSPYLPEKEMNTKVAGGKTLTVVQAGKFQCGCQVVLPDGTKIGWDPADPARTKDSGGEHDVRR